MIYHFHRLARLVLAISAIICATPGSAQQPAFPLFNIPGFVGSFGNPPVALDERVWHMKFSTDGSTLFTVTDLIHGIDWRKKQPGLIWQPSQNESLSRAFFSPDCSLFARLSQDDKVHVHETRTGKLLHTFDGRAPGSWAVAWIRDKELIAFGGHKKILIYQAQSGELVREIPQGQSDVIAVEISPDGKLLVAGNRSGGEEENGISLHHLEGHIPPINLPGIADRSNDCHLSFSPDSETLAVFCQLARRQTLYVWDVATSRIVRQHNRGYNAVAHSPVGNLLAASGLNNLQIWDTKTGQEVFRHQGESINEHIWSIAFSPDGQTLAAGIENRIKFRDTRDWKEVDPDPDLITPVSALAFTSDGDHLATGSLNGDLILWDWQKKTPVWKKPSVPGEWHIAALTIDPADSLIAVSQLSREPDGPRLRLLDLATGEVRHSLSRPPSTFPSGPVIHFRPDQKTALIGSDHALLEWDIPGNRMIQTIPIPFLKATETPGSYSPITTLRADPEDRELVWWTVRNRFGAIHLGDRNESCTFDGNHATRDTDPVPPRTQQFINIGPQIWNLPSLHRVITESDFDDASVRYPFGNLLFIGRHRKVSVFDALSQTIIHRFDMGYGDIKAITLTPDGRTLVAATTGGLRYLDLQPNNLPAGTSSEALWQLMGSDNHWQAYLASWALAGRPDFLPFISANLKPAREISAGEFQLVQSLLTDGNHEVRQTAARKLLDLGLPLTREIYETLRPGGLPSALPQKNPFRWDPGPLPVIPVLNSLSEHRRAMRAIMILLENSTPAAIDHLKLLAGGRSDAPVTVVSKTALQIHAAGPIRR